MQSNPVIDDSIDQALAVLLWGTDAEGEDDVVLVTGVLRVSEGNCFVDRGENPRLELEAEWLPRIKKTDSSIAGVVENAPFMLSLTVGDVEVLDESYRRAGLTWPNEPA